jgi:uncharacterized protein YdbL (DUF1318 family)
MKKTPLFKAILTAAVLSSAGVATGALIMAPAFADIASSKAQVDAAKAKGIVGEQNNGYLGFVTSGDAGLKAAVEEINAGRRDVFAQAAAKNGVSVEVAGQAAFAASIQPKVKSGEYYQDASGAWVKK